MSTRGQFHECAWRQRLNAKVSKFMTGNPAPEGTSLNFGKVGYQLEIRSRGKC